MAHFDRRTFMLSTSFGVLAARSAFAQADQVVFGAVLPLTGSSATIGEDQR